MSLAVDDPRVTNTAKDARAAVEAVHVFPLVLDDDVLLDELRCFENEQRRLDAAFTHYLTEAASRGVCDREEGLDTAGFLARESSRSVGYMRTRVQRSQQLHASFPRFSEALDRLRISWAHADVLCRAAIPRVLDGLVACEAGLLAAAVDLPFHKYRQLVLEVAAMVDQDGPTPKRSEDSELFITPLFDGTYHVAGVLCGDLGAAIAQLLDVETRRVRDRYRNDHDESDGEIDVPRTPTLRALALHDALTRAGTTTGGATVTDLTLTVELTTDETQACNPEPDQPRHSGSHTLSEQHDDVLDVLHNRLNTGVFRCLDGTRLRASQVESRLCDTAWRFLSLNSDGAPLAVGRTQRFATPAQRAAARRRDGGCVFPGCSQPAHSTELHHVWTWDTGGLTDIDNLASLCRHHHGVTHRAGWAMQSTADQWFTWTTPAGRTIHSQRRGVQLHRTRAPDPPRE